MEEGAFSRGEVIEDNFRRDFAAGDVPDDEPGGAGADEVLAGGGWLEEDWGGFEGEEFGARFVFDVVGDDFVG